MNAFREDPDGGGSAEVHGVELEFVNVGHHGIVERAVFALDEDGEVVQGWVSDDPGLEPGYDEVAAAGTAA
jgi:peroxiredoxin